MWYYDLLVYLLCLLVIHINLIFYFICYELKNIKYQLESIGLIMNFLSTTISVSSLCPKMFVNSVDF